MRVISGTLKGRSINFLKNTITRPLKDNVRENIFNILKHSNFIKVEVKNSNILDLYSGIGSFGIECISRGANQVTFVEKDKNTSDVLKENLLKLSIIHKSKIYNSRIENFFKKGLEEKFHIFFFDPPFTNLDFIKSLKLIKDNKIFKKKHIVIIHREAENKEEFKGLLEIVDTRLYGRSKIIFGIFN